MSPLVNMAPAFNTNSSYYYDFEKKEWRYGPTEDNYKKMVEYMNKFYAEGLVAPDFMAHKRKQFNDLLLQNKSFIASDYIGIMDELPLMLGMHRLRSVLITWFRLSGRRMASPITCLPDCRPTALP